MEHHSSLKVFRAMLAGLLLVAMFSMAQANLNIHGMAVSLAPMGDNLDFSLGMSKGKSKDCDDEDDEDEPEKPVNPGGANCLEVKPSAWTLSNMYRDQPLFMNFRPRTEEAMLIDNMCFTFFPLPDDQFTYVMYSSTVYRDGSNLIESDIVTDVQLGIFRAASPYCTYKDHVLGYAGCDTFVMYRCYLSNDCRNPNSLYTFGLSQSCKQISISCLQKIEDIIQGNGIPEQDYVALPMKMPTKCVFDPVCTFKGEVELGIAQSKLISPREIVIFEEPDLILPEFLDAPFAFEHPLSNFIDDTSFFSRPINLGPPGKQGDFLNAHHINYFKR